MPANEIPLINGLELSWANVSFMLAGVPVIGITQIDYDDTEEKENTYGSGKMPIGRGEGTYQAQVEMTLRASELEAIAARAPKGRLQEFGLFDIVVSYIAKGSTVRHTHKIRNCEFTGNKRSVGQGDKMIESSPGIICSHIEWQ